MRRKKGCNQPKKGTYLWIKENLGSENKTLIDFMMGHFGPPKQCQLPC